MATDPEFYKIKPERKKAEIILAKFKVGDTKSSKKFSIGGLAGVSLCYRRGIQAHSLRGSYWWGETGGVNVFMLNY